MLAPFLFLWGAELIMTLYANDFSKVFSTLLEKTGISCYQISQYTHLDQAYLSRLKTSKKQNPSPETIVKISLAICHFNDNIKLFEVEKLFKSTGRTLKIIDET